MNTMDSFGKEGFKIVRDGNEITLTQQEMSEFRYMDRAHTGRCSLEYVFSNSDFDLPEELKNELLENENLCEDITQNFEDALYEDSGPLEYDVVSLKVKNYVIEQLLEPAKQNLFDAIEHGKLKNVGDTYSFKVTDSLGVFFQVDDVGTSEWSNLKYSIELNEIDNDGGWEPIDVAVSCASIGTKALLWDDIQHFLKSNFNKIVKHLPEKNVEYSKENQELYDEKFVFDDDLYVMDEKVETINAYLCVTPEVAKEIEESTGESMKDIENVFLYANYNLRENTLELDGTYNKGEYLFEYKLKLTDEENSILKEKLEEYCREKEGKSCLELVNQIRKEDGLKKIEEYSEKEKGE